MAPLLKGISDPEVIISECQADINDQEDDTATRVLGKKPYGIHAFSLDQRMSER